MTVPLSPAEVEHPVSAVADGDLAARLRHAGRTARRTLYRAEVVLDLLRDLSASAETRGVAERLVAAAAVWLPLSRWAVVAPVMGPDGEFITGAGLPPEQEPAALDFGRAVLRENRTVAVRSLKTSRLVKNGPDVAALGFILQGRGAPVAALVGFDSSPSRTTPRLSKGALASMNALLGLGGFALDNALRIQRAEALSVTDDLTQLYNSRFLNQALHRETKRALRAARPLALLFVDLDGFKSINDAHGHLRGSAALVEAAAVIKASARETDIVARFGGDEFALVLPDTGSEGALAVGDRIRERIAGHAFLAAEGLQIRLSASVGVATLPEGGETSDALLQAADRAMYWVKDHGKNGIRLAPSGAVDPAAPADDRRG